MYRNRRCVLAFAAIAVCAIAAAQFPSGAQQPLPAPFALPDARAMTARQQANLASAKADIQQTCDEMDLALRQKRLSDFLAHRDTQFAAIDANGAWRSASSCRGDAGTLFANLLSAQRRTVVQTIALKGNLAEVYVSRHGSIIAKDPSSKLYDDTNIDSECRDIFESEGGHWLQYRSYTVSEEDIVNGKLVQAAPRIVTSARPQPEPRKPGA